MIYITGDTHGEFDRIIDFCEYYETSRDDIIIILGDAGINYYLDNRDKELKQELAKLPITLFCIHGNHEARPGKIPSYKEMAWRGGVVYCEKGYPNLLFAKDGEIYDFDGRKAVAIGGAYSIDKHYRIRVGAPWYADEQPDDAIKKYVEQRLAGAKWKVDYVLSHTCPTKYEPTGDLIPGIRQSMIDKSTETWLQTVEERLDYTTWYFGHFHVDKIIGRGTILSREIIDLI